MRKTRSGFTLIESVMVLSVAGVAAAMALPSAANTIGHTRVNQAALVAQADFAYAASLADRQRAPVRITVDATLLTVTLSDRNSGTVLATRKYGPTSDFKLGSLSASPAQIDIFPNGTASVPVSVILHVPGYTKAVLVSRAGQVRVVTP